MRLILEGPDNAGKTSLANRLAEACGPEKAKYFHPGGKPPSLDAELLCIEEQFNLLNGEGSIIMDRITPISQQVYNPSPSLDMTRRIHLERFLALEPVIIYCRPSTDKLMRVQDFTWRDDETEEHKQKIIRNQHLFIDRYDHIMAGVPCVAYNYEDTITAKMIYERAVAGLLGSVDQLLWFRNLMFIKGY